MARDQAVMLAASILGFVVLIVGSMGYMGIFAMNEVVSLMLMVVGIAAVIGSMIMLMMKERSQKGPEEE